MTHVSDRNCLIESTTPALSPATLLLRSLGCAKGAPVWILQLSVARWSVRNKKRQGYIGEVACASRNVQPRFR